MPWFEETCQRLAARRAWGYAAGASPATEPTALVALALLKAGDRATAARALDWLVAAQAEDGSLGVDALTPTPGWPTGWALLAWYSALQAAADVPADGKPLAAFAPERRDAWSAAANRALVWTLARRGLPLDSNVDEQSFYGHNTQLQGWPWVASTHSWVEPTAINLLALRSAGQTGHPRYREAVKLLLDRQLPNGGWNYGNTTILGNTLRPHVQPTGLALAALAAEPDLRSRVQPSLDYLQAALGPQTTPASLGYAILGLTAWAARPASADAWLAAACQRTVARDASPYKLALMVMA